MGWAMVAGVIIFVAGFAVGVRWEHGEQATPKRVDPYEKYRNKEGLLSAKAIKESSGK